MCIDTIHVCTLNWLFQVAVIKEEVTKKQISCETDLAKAEPALLAAQEALNTLNKV